MRLLAILLVSIIFSFFKLGGDYDNAETRSILIENADSFLGRAYDSKNGFDCSGFVQKCYLEIGYKLPRSSREQYKIGKIRQIDEAEIGDVIVFTGRNSSTRSAGHVGIVHHFQGDTLYFIHASSSHGIIINHVKQPYYSKRFLGIRNMIDDESLLIQEK